MEDPSIYILVSNETCYETRRESSEPAHVPFGHGLAVLRAYI